MRRARENISTFPSNEKRFVTTGLFESHAKAKLNSTCWLQNYRNVIEGGMKSLLTV